MKDLAEVIAALPKAVEAEDYVALDALAAKANNAFTVTIMYWRGKATDANTYADEGHKTASDLAVSSYAQSKEGVAFAAEEMGKTCAKCHAAHREKMPDGTYEIKP